MNRAVAWLSESNRWKHLAGGFAVGIAAGSVWSAMVTAVVAASCLEFKDRGHGCTWDWTDWVLTVAAGAVAAGVYLLLR